MTVYPAEAPHNVNNHGSDTARGLLTVVADCMAILGSNHLYLGGECFVVLSPEHAATIATSGWRKQDVRAFLYERARQPVRLLRVGGMYGTETQRNLWPRWVDHDDPEALIPAARRAGDISILVAGGGRETFGVLARLGLALRHAAHPNMTRGVVMAPLATPRKGERSCLSTSCSDVYTLCSHH